MKRFKSILACGLILAVAGLAVFTNAAKAEAAGHKMHAQVRSLHGEVNYSVNGTDWLPLRPNTELSEGAIIKTGPDGAADLQVNGRTSVVRISADSVLTLKTMTATGSSADAESDTMLDLANGTVVGTVKKITGDSTYRVNSPRGVAGIRGTDFAVKVFLQANGTYTVTFTSVTGTVVVVSNVSIGGQSTPVTKVLTTGQSYTPPATATSVETAQISTTAELTPAQLTTLAQTIVALPPTVISVTVSVGTTTPPVTVTHIAPTTNPSQTGG